MKTSNLYSASNIFSHFFLALESLVLAWLTLPYLRIEINPIFLFPLALVLYFAQGYCLRNKCAIIKKELLPHLFFGSIMSVVLILSMHVVNEIVDYQSGNGEYGYTLLGLRDICMFPILCYIFVIILMVLFHKYAVNNVSNSTMYNIMHYGIATHHIKWMFVVSGIFFMAWLPYFLIYYPGLIFGDSLNSIGQAMHYQEYSNHFPVFYTFLIELCLKIGLYISDITFGCAIYTVLQMICVSLILSYTVFWLRNKGVSRQKCMWICILYSFMSCYPQHAISMWKDAIFSAAIVFYSLKMCDLVISKGILTRSICFNIQLLSSIVIICLSRNNGVYVIAFSLIILLIVGIFTKQLKLFRSAIKIHILLIICILILTGMVYKALGIEQDDVESFGIPLQQIARVIAYDGEINESDKDFLNQIMPLERWKEVYKPEIVDPIKWDGEFSKDFFEAHKKEFLSVWMRCFVNNPKIYLEAWCLSTSGYWAPSLWSHNTEFKINIIYGNLDAIENWWIDFGIKTENLLKCESLKSLLSLETPLPSAGLLTCIFLFTIYWLIMTKNVSLTFLFLPCMGNIATLLIAAPAAYWPRYALTSYYLLPVALVIISGFLHKTSRCLSLRTN